MVLDPFRAGLCFSSKLTFQRTDSPSVVSRTAPNKPNFILSLSTFMDFRRPGLIGKIRTERIHPGGSQMSIHISATFTSSPNYLAMSRTGKAKSIAHSFSASCSNSTDFHDSNCATKLRSTRLL